LYGIAVVAVLTRSNTHYFLEPPGKMALINKSGFKANLRNRKALGEKISGVIYPPLNKVRMRRQTHCGAKNAQEMEFTQTCYI